MPQIDKEFLKELRDYVINSLNDAIDHNSPHRIPPIQDDLDKIDELLKVSQKNSCNCDRYKNMLEDVINELNLSEAAIDKYGPAGTPPAELVRMVIDEKDRTIMLFKKGFYDLIKLIQERV